MNIETLKSLINQGKSTRQIATALGKGQTTIRYWLKKYNLKTIQFKLDPSKRTSKTCPCCKENKPITSFYNRRNKIGNSTYCKSCSTIQVLVRQKKLKAKAVEYKGGKCITCGYNKCINALEFHHLDPKKKDFEISNCKSSNFDKVKTELDKCVLLCANCHREVHATNKEYSWEASNPIKIYEDTPLDSYQRPITKTKANYPSDEELTTLVWQYPRTHLSKVFKVSDNAISKYLKRRGIKQPPRGYWAKLAAQKK